jgi:hypothetical protein
MIVLGLVLILVAAGIVVFALASSSNYTTQIPLHGIGLSFTATPMAIYLAGAVSVILLGLGFALILRGTGREWGRHKEHQELKQLRKKNATAAMETADGSADDGAAKRADDSTSNGSDNTTEVLPEPHPDAE